MEKVGLMRMKKAMLLHYNKQNILAKMGALENPLWVVPYNWNVTYLSSILGTVPHFMSRSAIAHDLFDLIIEIQPSTTSAGFEEC